MRNIPAISREHGDPRKFPGGGRRRICNEITLLPENEYISKNTTIPDRKSARRGDLSSLAR